MDLHPQCEPLAFLLGVWAGRGRGEYPTIDSFEYLEEVSFGHVGKPFLSYVQKTRHATTGEPLHAEAGYLRPGANGTIELVLAQPSGIAEIHTGTVIDTTIELSSEHVVITPTAKSVTAATRSISVEGDQLTYAVSMAAVGQPMTHHLSATLRRTS